MAPTVTNSSTNLRAPIVCVPSSQALRRKPRPDDGRSKTQGLVSVLQLFFCGPGRLIGYRQRHCIGRGGIGFIKDIHQAGLLVLEQSLSLPNRERQKRQQCRPIRAKAACIGLLECFGASSAMANTSIAPALTTPHRRVWAPAAFVFGKNPAYFCSRLRLLCFGRCSWRHFRQHL